MSQRRAPHVRVPPPLVILLAVVLAVALEKLAFPLPIALGAESVRFGVGITLVGLGVSLILLAFRHFLRTSQDPTPWTPVPELIREGIYRYSRNPMYLGLGLIQIGGGLAKNSLWIVVLTFPALLIIELTAIRPEEVYLDRKFGKRYRRYRDSVRRWL